MATHFSILAWEIPWTEELVIDCLPCKKPGFNSWVRKIPWRRKWQPTSVFLPEESHGQRSLAGYSPRDPQESGMTQ